ncbi:MAG TPA: LysR family transcriptional regulator [Sphingobium sp.]
MATPDFNLLTTLDVLLAEGSVARAARRLQLSPSAMSRALARLRETTGDPLLVRAGRGLAATPRAIELRDHVRQLVQDIEAVLRPNEIADIATLERTFTIRASDGFAESVGPSLIRAVRAQAPHVKLRFVRKLDKDSGGLRDGTYDLETGVVAAVIGPEIRARALFRDRYVGVVRADHPLVSGPVTPERYAAGDHIVAWREGLDLGSIDQLLSDHGLKRNIVATVDGFSAALALARESDLIATVPERHTTGLRHGMYRFSVPVSVTDFTISLLWHPRMDGDPAHRWLRQCVFEAVPNMTLASETVSSKPVVQREPGL